MKLAAGFMATLRGNTAIQKLVRRKLIFLSVANSSVRVLAPKIESGGCVVEVACGKESNSVSGGRN